MRGRHERLPHRGRIRRHLFHHARGGLALSRQGSRSGLALAARELERRVDAALLGSLAAPALHQRDDALLLLFLLFLLLFLLLLLMLLLLLLLLQLLLLLL